MRLTQEDYDRLYVEWTVRHPAATHFVVICGDCHCAVQPGHDCVPDKETGRD